MLGRLLIYFAYSLKTSTRYLNGKRFFYDLLENPESLRRKYFDLVMITLVVSSIIVLIYDMGNPLGDLAIWFEDVVVAVFIVEYMLRGWFSVDRHKIIIEHYEKAQYLGTPFQIRRVAADIAKRSLDYMLTPFALIDLLAILPSYRPVRILRVLLIFRLFKLFRYSSNIKMFTEILNNKRFELNTLAVFLAFLVFISSSAFFIFENRADGGQVTHFFDAIYWSVVTVGTVGYGDIAPKTQGGRIVAIASILIGLGVLGFLTSILVTAFNEKLYEVRENRMLAQAERLRDFVIICGFGRVGQEVAALLQKEGMPLVIIDNGRDNVNLARKQGYLVFHDDASNNMCLQRAGINRSVKAILCTTGSDVTNVYITLTSRFLNPQARIISRANGPDNAKKMFQAGANQVIQPFETSGLLAAEYVGLPVALEAIMAMLSEEKLLSLEIVNVSQNSFIEGLTIAALGLPQRKLSLLGVISSNPLHHHRKNRYKMKDEHFYFNPDGRFILHRNDILVLLGRAYSIDHFRDQVEKSRLALGRRP